MYVGMCVYIGISVLVTKVSKAGSKHEQIRKMEIKVKVRTAAAVKEKITEYKKPLNEDVVQ